jgi:hypothetical protein
MPPAFKGYLKIPYTGMFSYLKVEKTNNERGFVKAVKGIRTNAGEATPVFETRFSGVP